MAVFTQREQQGNILTAKRKMIFSHDSLNFKALGRVANGETLGKLREIVGDR